MKDFTKINTQTQAGAIYDAGLRTYMVRIYKYMSLALILTGTIAFAASQSEAFLNMMYTVQDGKRVPTALLMVVGIAPILPWLVYFFRGARLSHQATHAVFWSYSALMGLSLFSIFITYTGESVARVFFISAAVFAGMSLYGYTTKKDLSGIGSFLIMGMWGLFVAMIVNIFLQSAAFDFALSLIAVAIFTGLTAYMNQQLKESYFIMGGDTAEEEKASVFGAMTLYITFINLFISLLRIMGDRR